MLIFSGYEKIAESVAKWELDPAGFRALRRVPWAVTEKIHGANFCFAVVGGKVRGANRRRLLEDDEPFFGWQAVRDTLAPRLQEVASRITSEGGAEEAVFIYGELFGGGYPHPEVKPTPGVAPVQTGIWYAPDIRFAAFDIAVGDGAARRYMDWEKARALLTGASVPCLTPLRIGTYEQATDYPIRFDSTIPATLGLPPLPPGSNLAEGVVVRPVREIITRGAGGRVRPLLKVKIAEFAEDKRFHEAQRWQEQSDTNREAGEPLDRLKWEAYCRVTQNRLDAALSKTGAPPARNRGRWARELFALLYEEIRDEARASDTSAWAALSSVVRGEWDFYVRGEVRVLLKGRFGEGG
ncbi:MAG: RNA ligase [Akkermansiaceae bacterium]|nr:RNA ligase [Armatimonadota bacterium]